MKADLHRHFIFCCKNPGHARFIPSRQFNVEDLPLHCRDTDLFNYITSVSNLTVRVTSKYISDERPPSYPFYSYRGQHIMRTGTGWVNSVYRFPDKYNSQLKECLCIECRESATPMQQFACITICTATHVVYDYFEGEHATCNLFFDEGCTPDTCSGGVAICGMWRVFSDVITDRCLMIHVTHDMDLADRLERMAVDRDYLKESYINKCLLYSSQEEEQNQQDGLVCLVSHPHGCSSNVSLGVSVDIVETEAGRIQYRYDTATCPGSSGGKIIALWKDWRMWGFEHTHSGGCTCSQTDQINHSSQGVGYLSPIYNQTVGSNSADSPANSEAEKEKRGISEVEECFPETDLHSRWMNCKKNSGHTNFTPIHQFSGDNLPADHRHLVKHIKALGDISALVGVKHISKNRPATFPGADTSYPRTPQRGTCWVYKILTYPNKSSMDIEKCTCEQCLVSDDPKTKFAYIIIHTAAHVVFDEFEGKHTTCYLFFDKGKEPETCSAVVKLTGMSRVWSDVQKDVCKMLYVTHDPGVIGRVDKVVNEWECARKSLEVMEKITPQRESSAADVSHQKLAITVSHPHGCSKQVSIGRCVRVESKGNGQTVCRYTTPTCCGSSGAYVFVEGRAWQSWDDNMHAGRSDSGMGINYSN